jgi:hypothetical protein
MKKSALLLLILVSVSMLYGQNDSIEKAVLLKKYLDKEIRQDDYSNTLIAWKQTLPGKYPDITLDSSGEAHYLFLYQIPGYTGEKLYSRTLEWLALRYGLLPAYIYSNKEDGKIIFRNTVNLSTGHDFFYTNIITIKNEKILMEFTSLGHQTYIEGHYVNDKWIPEQTIEIALNEVYPVILKKQSTWVASLKLLKGVNEYIADDTQSLHTYISTYDASYMF